MSMDCIGVSQIIPRNMDSADIPLLNWPARGWLSFTGRRLNYAPIGVAIVLVPTVTGFKPNRYSSVTE